MGILKFSDREGMFTQMREREIEIERERERDVVTGLSFYPEGRWAVRPAGQALSRPVPE